MPKISIIVPVYNVEKYLRRCLDSIINQTLQDIEIIVVNDCSPDNSQTIIDEYALKDTRIKCILHKENLGLGGARNTGIQAAKGEYIGFIDSDDWVAENMFENMLILAETKGVPIVACGIAVRKKGKVRHYITYPDMYLAQSDYDAHFLDILDAPYAWNKIYKRDFLFSHSFAFSNGFIEDLPCIVPLLLQAPAIYFTSACYYIYEQRGDSIMAQIKKNSQKLSDALHSFDLLELKMRDLSLSELIWQHYFAWKYAHHVGKFLVFDYFRLWNIIKQKKVFHILQKDALSVQITDEMLRASFLQDTPRLFEKGFVWAYCYKILFLMKKTVIFALNYAKS
jgi:glycosyltransferase involved in cell wall biosynthesis